MRVFQVIMQYTVLTKAVIYRFAHQLISILSYLYRYIILSGEIKNEFN